MFVIYDFVALTSIISIYPLLGLIDDWEEGTFSRGIDLARDYYFNSGFGSYNFSFFLGDCCEVFSKLAGMVASEYLFFFGTCIEIDDYPTFLYLDFGRACAI